MSLRLLGAAKVRTSRRVPARPVPLHRTIAAYYATMLPKKLSQPMQDGYDPVRGLHFRSSNPGASGHIFCDVHFEFISSIMFLHKILSFLPL